MYQKIKIVLFVVIFMIVAFGLSAQSDTIVSSPSNSSNVKQGIIVISKSDLIGFLEKIAKARKAKVQFDLEIYNSQYAHSTNSLNSENIDAYAPTRASSSALSIGSGESPQNLSLNDLMQEIEALNSRLNYMSANGGRYQDSYGGEVPTNFVASSGKQQETTYYSRDKQRQRKAVVAVPLVVPLSDNGELRWKIDSLERQVNILSAPATVVEKQDEISRLNREIGVVQDSLIVSVVLTPEAIEIVKQYGTSLMQVFFDNDASDVSSKYFDEVQRAATVLKKNTQLSVVLKGFASPVGSPKYNYDLSMRRNEAVKRMLIDYGVFPDQISSVFYGEDSTSSASEARRVDIKFIIK